MIPALRRRRGPSAWLVAADLLRFSWTRRRWSLLVLLALTGGAVVLAVATKATVPWLIYPAL